MLEAGTAGKVIWNCEEVTGDSHVAINSRPVDATRIIDVHEHHIPDILLNRDVNLLLLFRQSYAGWTERRGYALPSESQPEPIPAEKTTWEALAPFLEQSGSNGFVRNLVSAVTELHGNGGSTITRNNWEGLDEAVVDTTPSRDGGRTSSSKLRLKG